MNASMLLWNAAAYAACLYCLLRALVDLRQRRYVWAASGFFSALVLLLIPARTHAVLVEIPSVAI